jgi:hypothetical protein
LVSSLVTPHSDNLFLGAVVGVLGSCVILKQFRQSSYLTEEIFVVPTGRSSVEYQEVKDREPHEERDVSSYATLDRVKPSVHFPRASV